MIRLGNKKPFSLQFVPDIQASTLKYLYENSKPSTLEKVQELFNRVSTDYAIYLGKKQLALKGI